MRQKENLSGTGTEKGAQKSSYRSSEGGKKGRAYGTSKGSNEFSVGKSPRVVPAESLKQTKRRRATLPFPVHM